MSGSLKNIVMNTYIKWHPGLVPSDKETMIRSVLENIPVGRDFFNFVCGDFLGAGIHRAVFIYNPDPKLVIKFELTDAAFANVLEAHNWESVKYSPNAKWFAPVHDISAAGKILLQRRCQRPKDYEEYPDKVPVFMTDLKYKNWGKIGKRVVCMDYAGALLNQYGAFSKVMKKAEWWNQDSLL